ncbi:hypothetical protein EG329_011594 [Mollisiaceae sp. DMI_Dod_QoI]|nr:hypothetical protein EG329_011594 [Helotiales sp. DMI_Dod_QoI]
MPYLPRRLLDPIQHNRRRSFERRGSLEQARNQGQCPTPIQLYVQNRPPRRDPPLRSSEDQAMLDLFLKLDELPRRRRGRWGLWGWIWRMMTISVLSVFIFN